MAAASIAAASASPELLRRLHPRWLLLSADSGAVPPSALSAAAADAGAASLLLAGSSAGGDASAATSPAVQPLLLLLASPPVPLAPVPLLRVPLLPVLLLALPASVLVLGPPALALRAYGTSWLLHAREGPIEAVVGESSSTTTPSRYRRSYSTRWSGVWCAPPPPARGRVAEGVHPALRHAAGPPSMHEPAGPGHRAHEHLLLLFVHGVPRCGRSSRLLHGAVGGHVRRDRLDEVPLEVLLRHGDRPLAPAHHDALPVVGVLREGRDSPRFQVRPCLRAQRSSSAACSTG